jgi:hypothetical protein
MDHREVLFRLDDYGEGRLSETMRLEVEEHLRSCDRCAREAERARRLGERVAELPRSLEPGRDLWEGVRARITAPATGDARRRSWSWPPGGLWQGLAAAAAMAVLLLGTWLVAERMGRPESVEQPRTQPLPEELTRTLWGLESENQGAGRVLMAAMQTGRGSLAEEGLEAINQGLNALSLAIAESQAALREDPENPELVKRLTRYYQQRLELLHRATRLATRT